MPDPLAPIIINDTSGTAALILSSADPRQLLLKIVGADVWANFNGPAEAGKGMLIKDGDIGRFWGDRDNSAVYLTTSAGKTAIGYLAYGYSNMEVQSGGLAGLPGSFSFDASRRLRVSQITTLLDGKVVNGHTPLLFESAGTGTHVLANAKNSMTVDPGEWVIFQSNRHYPYFSGKVQLVEPTFDNFHPEAGVEKLFGYFSSNAVSPFDSEFDGIYLHNTGSTIKFKITRKGTPVYDKDITEWTGYDLLGEYQDLANWQNFTVCAIEFLWLGGAIAKFWLKTQNGFVLAHQEDYSGTAQDVFMLNPNQPLRFEMRSTTGTGTFRYICSQIATEGSFEESGLVRSVNTGPNPLNLTTSGVTYPIIGLRKNNLFRGVAVVLEDFNVFVSSATDQVLWTIHINPVISGAGLVYNTVAKSAVEYGVGDGVLTVTTDGEIMASGPTSQNSIMPTDILQGNFLAYLGGLLNNTMDQYVLCGTPIAGKSNCKTVSTMSYKEY